jgi:hypothetical protein
MSEQTIWAKLAAPLDPRVIKMREQAGKTLRYIDSRAVDDILDANAPGEWDVRLAYLGSREVVGRNGEALGQSFAIKASLTVYGVTREDVGEGRDYKAAASDALKRAAVRFGIGRELYGEKPSGAKQGLPAASAGATSPSATGKSAATAAPAPTATIPIPSAGDFPPPCPKCGGKMWDNRVGKRNPKAPDAKCRDRSCDGVVWPEKPNAAAKVGTPATQSESDSEYLARMKQEMEAEEIPF